jgi:hypothetical protein
MIWHILKHLLKLPEIVYLLHRHREGICLLAIYFKLSSSLRLPITLNVNIYNNSLSVLYDCNMKTIHLDGMFFLTIFRNVSQTVADNTYWLPPYAQEGFGTCSIITICLRYIFETELILLGLTQFSSKKARHIGGKYRDMFLLNPPDYMASHGRRLCSSWSLLWEPQIQHELILPDDWRI